MAPQSDLFEEFEVDPKLFYDAFVKSTDNYIYIVNMKTDVALVSPNMLEDFELPGRLVPSLVPVWGKLVHPRDREWYFKSIEKMLGGETDEHNVEYQVCNRKGEYLWVLCKGYLKRDESGKPTLFAGAVTNLGSKGKFDYTTGLFTYRECEKLIDSLLKKGACGGFLLLGLDDFVRINDLNSHIFGDAVLRQFAQSIQQMLPAEASMYRFDGDEFAIVCPDSSDEEMETLYQKIHAYGNRTHLIDDSPYFCTASAGVATFGGNGDTYQKILNCASGALDASKQKGKNTATFFSADIDRARRRSLELANRLQLSVIGGMKEFRLVFQSLARSTDLEITGAEALLRWSCDCFGEVSPSEFIPVLESSGLILPVGSWVLEEAVKTCKKWTRSLPDFVMNVNVSYLQMLDESFVPFVAKLLESYDLAAEHLVLELTESCFVTDMAALKDTFRKLRAMNIRIAMDDFGTGYSSLGLLAQSPADVIKIDRMFISAIGERRNTFNRSFIRSVIQLCHGVGITVCVEGVERAEELKTVCSLDADSIQGYYISRPVDLDSFEKKFLGRAVPMQ